LLNVAGLLSDIYRWAVAFALTLRSLTKTRAAVHLENLALRHQLSVLRRTAPKRPRLNASDRLFWIFGREFVQQVEAFGIRQDVLDMEDPPRQAWRPKLPKENRELIRK
jgi:hypothetical protein